MSYQQKIDFINNREVLWAKLKLIFTKN
jgi:hypothetical protein